MTKPHKNNNGLKWFERGEEDYSTSVLLFKYGGPSTIACFHAQQAAEKYLKGYLAANGIMPRKIHNLEELAKDCSKVDPEFLEYLDDCLLLTRHYIETRYPMPVPMDYASKEVEEAIDLAEKIINLVKRRVSS